MEDTFRSDIPIYLQLVDIIKTKIATGAWPPGEKIPAVRDLAVEFGVNPNTMQRSLSELERDGLLYSERTAGRYATKDKAMIAKARREMAMEYIENFLKKMFEMGFSKEQIKEIINKEVENYVKSSHD